MLGVMLPYICISFLLQTKDDFRFVIPYVEFSKEIKGGRPLIVDTSSLIDGRIADIMDTNILDTELVIPSFVLEELQAIADSSDKLRRIRGRRGLDVLTKLQQNPKVEVRMYEVKDKDLAELTVDQRLVALAKRMGGRVVTNDFNLNKVAFGQGVGYLDDGTMVVSEQANTLVGKDIDVVVPSMLQNSAGRMIFGRMPSPPGPAAR